MDAFWAITLSVILIRKHLKGNKPLTGEELMRKKQELRRNTIRNRKNPPKLSKAEIEEIERREHADELITVVLPTIRDGSK